MISRMPIQTTDQDHLPVFSVGLRSDRAVNPVWPNWLILLVIEVSIP